MTTNWWRTVTVLAASLSLAGCLGGNTIACDFPEDDRCQDRSGVQAANPLAYQGTCEAAGGDYLDHECPRVDIVGGCDLGSDVIDWYYAPTTTDEIARECEGDGTVVDP